MNEISYSYQTNIARLFDSTRVMFESVAEPIANREQIPYLRKVHVEGIPGVGATPAEPEAEIRRALAHLSYLPSRSSASLPVSLPSSPLSPTRFAFSTPAATNPLCLLRASCSTLGEF